MVFSLRPFNIVNATLACHNSPIPIVSKFKLLGITLDPTQLESSHRRPLEKVSPYINQLKMLSSTYWAGNPEIMTMVYKPVIRSKLDYASPL